MRSRKARLQTHFEQKVDIPEAAEPEPLSQDPHRGKYNPAHLLAAERKERLSGSRPTMFALLRQDSDTDMPQPATDGAAAAAPALRGGSVARGAVTCAARSKQVRL